MPCRVYIAVSVDGLIAPEDGTMAWLDAFHARDFGSDAFVEGVGAVIIGRITYEQIRGFGEWPYSDLFTVVVATEPLGLLPPKAEQVSSGVAAAIARAEELTDKDIWINGGGRLIRGALDAGLVDTLELFVIPLLLGKGISLFASDVPPRELALTGCEQSPGGVVRLAYDLRN